MKKTAIIVGALFLLSGIVYAVTLPSVVPKDINDLAFEKTNLVFVTENTKWATTTDEQENEIRTGIRIPVTYDFPIATSSGFVVEQVNEDIGMTLDAYNMCRFNGKTKTVCMQELNDDIVQTVDAFKENKARELDELKRKHFQDELTF